MNPVDSLSKHFVSYSSLKRKSSMIAEKQVHRSLGIKVKKKKKIVYCFSQKCFSSVYFKSTEYCFTDKRISICMEHFIPTLTSTIIKTNYVFWTKSLSQSPVFYYLMLFCYMLVLRLQCTSDAYKESLHVHPWYRSISLWTKITLSNDL